MTEKNRIKLLEGGVAGLKYALDIESEEGKKILGSLRPGMELTLIREKDNRYDSYAVGIFTQDKKQKLGYVSRYKNETVARLIDQGAEIHAYIADQENTEPMKKKTPTEDMLLTFSLYLVKSETVPAIVERSPYNEALKAKIKKFIVKCTTCKLPENIRRAAALYMQEFVIALITTDGIIAWQEVEFLQMYLATPVNQRTLAKIESISFDFHQIPSALKSLVAYENEHDGCSGLSVSYIDAVKALGLEAIGCDNRITAAEETNYRIQISVLDHYLQQNLRKREIITYAELDEEKKLYDSMDMDLCGLNLKKSLKKDLLRWMAAEKQKGKMPAEYSCRTRLNYILGIKADEKQEEIRITEKNAELFDIEHHSLAIVTMKMHLNENKLYYTEMIDLYQDVFHTIANAVSGGVG